MMFRCSVAVRANRPDDEDQVSEFASIDPYVNINVVEVMPTDQVAVGFAFGAVSDEN